MNGGHDETRTRDLCRDSAPSAPSHPLAAADAARENHAMESSVLAQLLRLPPGDRADLAMALWESLSDDDREGELALSPEQRAELDRRLADHEMRPDNVVPWSDVRRKLLARE
jgi:putative addiction module component (TIGR02574 family)